MLATLLAGGGPPPADSPWPFLTIVGALVVVLALRDLRARLARRDDERS
jgi:hypothetical protein